MVESIVPEPVKFPTYAYTVFLFSELEKLMRQNTIMSDVVSLLTMITDVFPSSGAGQQQRRPIHITDGHQHAVVILWGDLADAFDADGP